MARLAALHSTLTTRLTLQSRLLTLNGRLDLVLSQVELRSSNAPAPLSIRKGKNKRGIKVKAAEPTKYVEGESSDENGTTEGVEIEIENDDDDMGSIEDVELGAGSSSEESENDEEDGEETDDDDDESNDGNLGNGFIDDEAEDAEEDESDESE